MLQLSRNPVICAVELDGDMCLFHPDTAQYLTLNATGSAIWNLLEEPMNREQLLSYLLQRYAIERADCHLDTEAFLAEAIECNILLEQHAPQ
jgi:hypothetical protein